MIGRCHETSRTRLPAAVLVVLVLSAASCAPGDDEPGNEARVEEREAELTQARERIRELEAELAEAGEEPAEGEPQPAGTPAPPRTPEGLVEQLHTYFADEALPEGVQPGTTAWEAADIPPGFGEADGSGHATPGELVTALVGELAGVQLGSDAWEVTARVLAGEDGEATAAVLTWGLADDAIAGSDLRLYLARGDAGWYVESAEERFRCRRGVSDGLCV